MKIKKNNYLLKLLSIIMVLVLISMAFSACAEKEPEETVTTPSSENVQQPAEKSGVFTLDSLEPLSAEKQAEIEAAWGEQHSGPILWEAGETADGARYSSERYYGTYNGCVVFFTHTNLTAIGKLELAGQTITHGTLFKIWIYSDGEFYELTSANQYEWFEESDLLKIVEYHNEYEAYVKEIRENSKKT